MVRENRHVCEDDVAEYLRAMEMKQHEECTGKAEEAQTWKTTERWVWKKRDKVQEDVEQAGHCQDRLG